MESWTQARGGTAGMADRGVPAGNRELKILDVMSKDVITALPADTLLAAVQRMSETEVSCLVVMDGVRVLGILTERDVLKAVAGPQTDFHRIMVAQAMSSPVQSVSPILSVLTAGRIMEARQIRRLPVLEAKQLVGIVTQTDITRGLITLIPLRSISDIMTREVVTVASDASVAEAARLMASNRISCVVVLRGNDPAGILTEKDVIRRVVTLQKDPTETRVADVMSSPITTVPPSYSVLGVSRKMDAMHLHRLVVMDTAKPCGIVTQTDIMRAIRAELERLENERWGWMTELTMLIQSTIGDLQKLEQVLHKLSGASAAAGRSLDTGHPPTSDQVEILGSPFRE